MSGITKIFVSVFTYLYTNKNKDMFGNGYQIFFTKVVLSDKKQKWPIIYIPLKQQHLHSVQNK